MQNNPIYIDDFDQFPQLNQRMEKTSTPTKSNFSVSPTDFETTIAFFDITDPVLKATITSFIQDNELPVSNSDTDAQVIADNVATSATNIDIMDITDLSMEIAHPYKNHETNSVTTFMNIDKLYELATTQAHIGSSIPQRIFLLLMTPITGKDDN
jgi:hypothetical protein